MKLEELIQHAHERHALTRLVATLRVQHDEDAPLPVIEIDPRDPQRLRYIPAIGGAGGVMPGTSPHLEAAKGTFDIAPDKRDPA